MSALSQRQKDQFWRDGVLVVEEAVTSAELAALREAFLEWVDESKAHGQDYGETLDGRARFDLEPGHTATVPALRRVQSPEEISQVYRNVMRNSGMVDFVSDLIGPSLRFHHGKVNSKLPGAATKVKFHQDFTFQPMTNDDMITALLFVDDVTLENGPLEVVPATHKGPLYSLWHKGVFTGAVADEVFEEHRANIIKCTGKAGSVCLMHSCLLHGSAPNLSDRSRTLYIATYYAEDAKELSPNALPSALTHELVRGEDSGRIRCSSYEMEIPEVPKDTSFFAQQAAG
ncbi:phytanoyl-CoA dioxygenase family protein [Pelagibius sp. Alg239-R121]|uniref:phytanoyl-CoA dioxygenase family protein n=1 Tax=Pelagibius sp. Alg239-R121 TaxID=2993448 RepID=UPI0024A696DF|nr:phytanoyl-CoA dioxygenase family protein [Pelagibius sp. Alg239-R121]